jgi:hypothetical protein
MDNLDFCLSCIEDLCFDSAMYMECVFKEMIAQETLLWGVVIQIRESECRVDTVCHNTSSLLIRNLMLGFSSLSVSKIQETYLPWSTLTVQCSHRFQYHLDVISV